MSSINNGAGQIMSSITSAGLLTIPSVSATTMTVASLTLPIVHDATMVYVNTNAVGAGTRGSPLDPYASLAAAVAIVLDGDVIVLQTDISETVDLASATLWAGTTRYLTIVVPLGVTWSDTTGAYMIRKSNNDGDTTYLDVYCHGIMRKTGSGVMVAGQYMGLSYLNARVHGGGSGIVETITSGSSGNTMLLGVGLIEGLALLSTTSADQLFETSHTSSEIRDIKTISSSGTATLPSLTVDGGYELVIKNCEITTITTTGPGIECGTNTLTTLVMENVIHTHTATTTASTASAILSYGSVRLDDCKMKTTLAGSHCVHLNSTGAAGSVFNRCLFVTDVGAIDRLSTYEIQSCYCITNNAGMDGTSATNHTQNTNTNTGVTSGNFYIDLP
jgi:hypothetical protein